MRSFWILLPMLLLLVKADAQQCEALFSFDNTNLTIQFTDQSTHSAGNPIISWFWDFDDGGTSTQQNPLHTFPEADRYDVNLTITTQNGCQSNLEIRIEICDFGISYSLGACNAQGQIPVTLNITDIFDNANEVDVILDGQNVPGSPFQIDAQNPVNIVVLVPGNGLSHTITVQSLDIETCGRTISFSTEDCSSDCFLSALNVSYAPGVTHNVQVGDNFFAPQSVAIILGDVVHFTWAAGGHSTTSDAMSGPDSWNSGVIGGGSTFDVNIHNPGTHNYYCIPHGGPNGAGMSGQILSNCPSGNSTNLKINFTTTLADPQGYNILWDNVAVPGSPFNYNGTGPQTQTISISGDGMPHNLVVRDVADPLCDLETTYNAPDCNQGGGNPVCSISGTIGNFGGCSNMNVTATLTVMVTNGGTGFNASIDGGPNTFYTYTGGTTTVTITLPGNGGSHSVVITDNADPACSATINTVTPDCNIPCSITNLTAVAASGSGGPSGIFHTVNVEDFQFNPTVVNISAGDIVRWVWTGNIAHTSTSDAPSGPESWDSGLLNNGATYDSPLLPEGTYPYYCIPHGAPGGVGMSGNIFVLPPCNANNETTVQVNFDIVSNGVQGFDVLVDGAVVGTFPYVPGNAQSAAVLVPGDGLSHTIQVRDVANNSCNASTTVITSDCNGGGNPVCTVAVTATVSGGCSGGNVPVTLVVTASNNAPTYTVTVDGVNAGTYNYSAQNVTINIAGDGNLHTIVVTDSGDPACSATTQITTPNCSLPCGITSLTATTSSGSGGPSGIVHTVNVEDFQFNPNTVNITVGDEVQWVWTGAIPHTSTSDVVGGVNSWDSGLLNNGATYTSPVLEEGVHPYYCTPHGAPGGVGMAGTIHVLPACNSLGETTVQLNFNLTNGGASGFEVLVDGTSAGTFAYVPGTAQSASVLVAGDGASHTIIVQDVLDIACNASVSVTTPDCGGGGNPVCMVSFNPAVTGGCNNGNVAVLLNVTAVNNASTYTVTVDGQGAGTFEYANANAQVNVPGNGQPHTIVITDDVDPLCTATSTITTPDCTLPCMITINQLSFGTSVSHTIQVQDFQFAPGQVSINLGDTLNFVWTGVIPHTVTSDSPAGPNAFNSGLLGQGATWQLILNSTGSFPYYCIPHGAPGGVGMSGVINVTSSCNEGVANGTLDISYTNVSGQGFHVTQDGNAITGSPFAHSPSGQLTIPLAVNGDGASHTFVVTDAGNAGCSAQQISNVPNCGTVCSLNITQASVSGCTGNTVTLNVGFSSTQPTATYNIYKNGLKLNPNPLTTDGDGNGSYSTMIVGNNSVALISVQFIDNAACMDTMSITVPDCAGPCLISDFQIGQLGVVRIVEVKDFVFDPPLIDVLIGDTVRFVWTGVIPHTSTSDAFTGPNAWSSGLLGQGAMYDVVITSTGSFPYYCQPHGGPGGIGMSGVIQVLDTCDQDRWLTNLSFNVSAGSPLGYNVFVDGVKITPIPIPYDNPVGYNEEIVGLPGDGSWHLVTIQDLETGFCAYTQPVLTSICGVGCSVINLTANTGANIIHTIEVRDYDYAPLQITIGAGEKIRFVWTGVIPHTVTSDALTGPEVWDSGLLGNGAVYDLVINTPGVHPYFCIPHGGPGGIGMSGSITVLPACTDNKENIQVNFDVTNGSAQGYQLFVDGMLYGTNPRTYQNRMGSNSLVIAYPADQSQHIITIQDLQNNICAASDFFTTGSCSATCEITGFDYYLGNGRTHEVLVRDFDFAPKNLKIELGDTILFNWTGAIPHTVTSDIASGVGAFNSGLLGQGSTYKLVLTSKGMHPYYCIPHGGPGGIGMAGSIEVVDPCDDGQVFVDFQFFSSGPGASYDVLNHGSVVLNDLPYQSGGVQHFTLELPAQGQSHLIQVSDNGPDDCMMSIPLDSFDCSNPCFLVRSDFKYNINFSTLEVSFQDRSRGDIIAWNWNFGDGSTSTLQHPKHTYSEATLHEICLTITDINGCIKTRCDKLRLGANVCRASFAYAQDGLDLIFYNTSDVSNPQVTATWSFGDGGASTQYDSAAHTFELGVYEICITVTSLSCVNTYCETIDLSNPCLALKAKYSAVKDGGDPLLYHFQDLSSGPVGSRLWGFGDGQISSQENPTHLYAGPGIYTVCLLTIDMEGNCTNSDCRTLFVGTTSTDTEEIKLHKLHIVPNPVPNWNPNVEISGFDINDIGTEATIKMINVQGVTLMSQEVILGKTTKISTPYIPGLYYILVVSAGNRYGAMIAVQ